MIEIKPEDYKGMIILFTNKVKNQCWHLERKDIEQQLWMNLIEGSKKWEEYKLASPSTFLYGHLTFCVSNIIRKEKKQYIRKEKYNHYTDESFIQHQETHLENLIEETKKLLKTKEEKQIFEHLISTESKSTDYQKIPNYKFRRQLNISNSKFYLIVADIKEKIGKVLDKNGR